MMARRLQLLILCGLLAAAAPAVALDARYPDWPCRQLKVPELSEAAIWPGPPRKDAGAAPEIPGVKDLAAKLAATRTPMDEAETEIAGFISGTPTEKIEKAAQLFFALFDTLNSKRLQVFDGIERAYRRQREFAVTVRADGDRLHALQDASADDGQIAELVTRIQWETRIFDERRKMLSYACEVPVEIDRRIFALARAIRSAAGMG
jgi:hypothetical protein